MLDTLRSWFAGPQPSRRDEEWQFAAPSADGLRPLPVVVHARRARHVVVMLPGWNAAIDGYCGKYASIADLLQSRGLAVVRTGNAEIAGCDFASLSRARARGMLAGALQRARRICGRATPELSVLGISAGAGALAAVAPEFASVTRMLLIAPSADAGEKEVLAGMAAFAGETYVVAAANDDVVGAFPRTVFDRARRAQRRELKVIPDCDHQFRGARNGRVLSQAPLWAFLQDEPFPDAARGIHLYD